MQYKFTKRAEKALQIADNLAIQFGHQYIGTEHLLYGLIKEGEGVAIRTLYGMNIDVDSLYDDFFSFSKVKNSKLIVDTFGVDLNKKSLNGELDPVVYRDKEISRLYYPDFFTKNEYNTLKSDYVNILGNKLNSKYYDYIYNVPIGDSTEIKYVSGDYSRDNPITSGEANFDIAVLNDSLSQFYLGYEEDPVTGKNIYEDKNRELEKELEHIDSDILKALKIQSLNLEDMYPSIDENDNDFYFALNGLLICNGNHISDYYNYSRAKEILVIINDEVEVKYTLNDSDEFQFIDFKYVQKDITKPINLKIKVLSTYSGYRSKNIYFSHIIPAVSSNIPQGR